MKSRITRDFRTAFAALPHQIQRQAVAAYGRFRENPAHPGLHVERIHGTEPIYSVRIGLHWRALALRDDDTLYWFWIGSHADYDRLIAQ